MTYLFNVIYVWRIFCQVHHFRILVIAITRFLLQVRTWSIYKTYVRKTITTSKKTRTSATVSSFFQSVIDISHRYLSSIALSGISHRHLPSASLNGISHRYLSSSSVSLLRISHRYLSSASLVCITHRYQSSVSPIDISHYVTYISNIRLLLRALFDVYVLKSIIFDLYLSR